MNNDTFCRLPVTNAQGIIGLNKYPDAGILLNYDDVYFSQGYGEIKEAFRALKKMISHDDFISSNIRVLMLVIIYVFSIYDISKILQPPNQSK